MAANGPFALSRATVDDMVEIAQLLYRCFPQDESEIFTGMRCAEDYPLLVETFKRNIDSCDDLFWIKVVDQANGKIVAASEWRINFAHAPRKPDMDPPDNLEGETKEKSIRLHQQMNAGRAKAMKGPFLHLHICFTDSNYRRRGAGGMMLQWGIDIADQFQIPGWIEASADGNYLYKRYGFYDYEKVHYDGHDLMNMKREPRTTPTFGGK